MAQRSMEEALEAAEVPDAITVARLVGWEVKGFTPGGSDSVADFLGGVGVDVSWSGQCSTLAKKSRRENTSRCCPHFKTLRKSLVARASTLGQPDHDPKMNNSLLSSGQKVIPRPCRYFSVISES